MSQQVRKQKQRTINYTANSVVEEIMDRGAVLREVYIRLKGQLTVTAANNTAAKTKRGDEWAVVKKIELVANNTDVIKSIDGNALYWLNYFMYGVPPKITATLGDATTDDPSFDSTLILPVWIPRSVRPLDTALDTAVLSSLKLRITWGIHTDINGDATAFTTAPTVEFHTLDGYGLPEGTLFAQWRMYQLQYSITATNPQFQVILPVNKVFRGFLINATEGANDATNATPILNNFKWKSGQVVFADQPSKVLKEQQSIRYGQQRFADTAIRQGTTANNYGGWYFYDHVTDGMMNEAIDTMGMAQHELELDVTAGAASKINIYPLELIPVRQAAAKAA